MVLDFGTKSPDKTIQTSDYRTAGSHQNETLKFLLLQAANTWTEIYTVPTDKTYYVSAIIVTHTIVTTSFIGTGAAASESEFIGLRKPADDVIPLSFESPIKFSGGTRISAKATVANDTYFTLIGWEE